MIMQSFCATKSSIAVQALRGVRSFSIEFDPSPFSVPPQTLGGKMENIVWLEGFSGDFINLRSTVCTSSTYGCMMCLHKEIIWGDDSRWQSFTGCPSNRSKKISTKKLSFFYPPFSFRTMSFFDDRCWRINKRNETKRIQK